MKKNIVKPVPGTVFEVKDGNGNVLGRYTTGQDGTVTVTGLIPGNTYVVTEVKVPDGYVLDSTPQRSISSKKICRLGCCPLFSILAR